MVLLAFAGFLAWMVVRDERRAADSGQWPMAEGTVIVSEVDTERHASSNGARRSIQPKVRYNYEVGGTSYEGWRVSYTYVSGQEESQKVVARYPTGSTVKVRHLPGDPRISVLEPGGAGFKFGPWAGISLFVFLALVGCGVPLWRDLKKSPPVA